MADKKIQISLELQNGQYIAKVRETSSETEKFKKKTQDVATGAAAGFQRIYNAAKMYLGVKLVGYLLDLAGRFDDVKTSFENLTSSMAGGSQALLKSIQTAAKGTVSQLDIMKSSNLAITLMGEEVAETLPKMMEIAVATAQSQGVTVAQMYNDIIVASGRQSVQILDNLGISSVTAGKYMEEYAGTLGKTRLQLNETEKRAAFFYAVMKAGGEIIDKNGETSLTFGQRLQVMKAKGEDAAAAFTEKLLPGLEQVMLVLTETDLGQDSIISQIGEALSDLIIVFSRFILQLKSLPSMARQTFNDIKDIVKFDFDKSRKRDNLDNQLENKYNTAVKKKDRKGIQETIDYLKNNRQSMLDMGYDDAYISNQIQLMQLELGYSDYKKTSSKKSGKGNSSKKAGDTKANGDSDAAKKKYEADQKYLQSFRQATMSEYEIIQDNYQQDLARYNSITDEKLKATEEYGKARLAIEKKYQDQVTEYIISKTQSWLSFGSSALGEISNLYNMASDNKIRKLDEEYAKQVDVINNSVASEEEKENRLAMLEADYEAKKKREQIRNAKVQKKIALLQAMVDLPAAVIATFRNMGGWPWGVIPAGIMGAIGAKKIQMIKDQPVALAAGGTVTDPTFALLGEGKYPESVLPHSNKTFDALGEGIERARSRNGAAYSSSNVINHYHQYSFAGPYYDKDGFIKAVTDANREVESRTGAKVYAGQAVFK